MADDPISVITEAWSDFGESATVESELAGVTLYPVVSSNLAAVGYDQNRYELYVAFLDGSLYRYSAVPEEDFVGLMKAESHGEFFYDEIRLAFSYERIAG
jgi:hypothetical protein